MVSIRCEIFQISIYIESKNFFFIFADDAPLPQKLICVYFISHNLNIRNGNNNHKTEPSLKKTIK